VCTATRGARRAAAASNANAIAASLLGLVSIPTTTGAEMWAAVVAVARSAPRTTTTGHTACDAMATATEPASNDPNRPWPRSPTTSNSASSASAASTPDADPTTSACSTWIRGLVLDATSTAAPSSFSDSACRWVP
jgi:hypothetical protein